MYSSQITTNFNYSFNKNNKKYTFMDPLLYFEVGFGRCGDISRFCVDLFKAGFKYNGRLLQFKNHVTSEIQINGEWKIIDIDLNSNTNIKFLDGIQLIKTETIDKYTNMTTHNPIFYMINDGSYGKSSCLSGYPSIFYNNYNNYFACIYKELITDNLIHNLDDKTESGHTELNHLFHWNRFKTFLFKDNEMKLITERGLFSKTIHDYKYNLTNNLLHQMLQFSNIEELDNNNIKISWVKEDIIKTYNVLVSDKSREWNYIKVYNQNIEPYIHKITLEDNNFNKIYDEINSNIYNYEIEDTSIIINKQDNKKLYVSIIPKDHYGYSINRVYYLPSEELII